VPYAQIELYLALGEITQAEKIAQELLTILESRNYRGDLVEAWLMMAQVYLVQKRTETAYTALQKGRKIAEAIGDREVFWRILWELSQLDQAAGKHDESERYHQQAREEISYIADHAGSDELRTAFLNMPEVQTILSTTGGKHVQSK
jgi:tetratricopeptide (TPR) repeat protein